MAYQRNLEEDRPLDKTGGLSICPLGNEGYHVRKDRLTEKRVRVIEISLPKEGHKTDVEKFYVMPEDFKAAMVRICMRFVKRTVEISVDDDSPEAGEARRNKIVLTSKKRRK